MEIKRTYSLADIAKRLDRPRTTLADWSTQFREFMPTMGSGRSMRYKEEALELFGLISRMKDANEPPEYIREQLRGVAREIVVTTDDDDKQPYLLQLAGEVDEIKRALVMLAQRMEEMTTANDGARREAADATEQLAQRLEDVTGSIKDELRQGQEQTAAQLGEILSRVETFGKRKKFLGLF